jgi:hypothetical protein
MVLSGLQSTDSEHSHENTEGKYSEQGVKYCAWDNGRFPGGSGFLS